MDPEWSCIASVELIIKSNKTDVNDFSAKYSHHFSQIEDECGYPRFKTLKVRSREINNMDIIFIIIGYTLPRQWSY